MNAVLNEALDKYKKKLVCPSAECESVGSLARCGRNQKNGLQNVKCTECGKQTTHLTDVIFNSVGVKLEFEGKEMTSDATAQDDVKAFLRNQVQELQSEKAEMAARIQELLESNKYFQDSHQKQNTQIAKLTTQAAEQNKTIANLSENIATLTKALTGAPVGAQASPDKGAARIPALVQGPVQDEAELAAPEGSVACLEIQKEPAGNEDKNKAGPGNKVSWADIAKDRRPSLETLPEEAQNRFKESSKSLAAIGFRPVPGRRRKSSAPGAAPENTKNHEKEKPKVTPLYFGGIPRGPIGKLRAELRKCLPKWTILHLSFIGNTVTEILCHEPLVDKLVGGMKLLGFRHIPNYDPLKEKNTDDATLRARVNCYNRWRWGADSSHSEVSRQWFKEKMESLAAEHPAVKEAADDKHKSNTANKLSEKEAPKDPEKESTDPAPAPDQSPKNTEAQQRLEGENRQ